MAMEATLSRVDKRPLGDRDGIVKVFQQHFAGINFGWTPSGSEKIEAAHRQGIEFPQFLKEQLEKRPAIFEGDWSGPNCSLQLFWSGEASATEINLEFRGDWGALDPFWTELVQKQGWQITYHTTLTPDGSKPER